MEPRRETDELNATKPQPRAGRQWRAVNYLSPLSRGDWSPSGGAARRVATGPSRLAPAPAGARVGLRPEDRRRPVAGANAGDESRHSKLRRHENWAQFTPGFPGLYQSLRQFVPEPPERVARPSPCYVAPRAGRAARGLGRGESSTQRPAAPRPPPFRTEKRETVAPVRTAPIFATTDTTSDCAAAPPQPGASVCLHGSTSEPAAEPAGRNQRP